MTRDYYLRLGIVDLTVWCFFILLAAGSVQQQHPTTVMAFNAHLTRPWQFKRGHLRIRTRKKSQTEQQQASPCSNNNNLLTVSSSSSLTTLSSSSSASTGGINSPDGSTTNENIKNTNADERNTSHDAPDNQDIDEQLSKTRMTPPLLETNSSRTIVVTSQHNSHSTAATSASKSTDNSPRPTVWNQLGPLTAMTRPQNFPGIFCFHVLGIYIALQSAHRMDLFVTLLLAKPSMWLVFSSVILVSCTSMVVNDYYDAKLGRDTSPDRPLVRGDLSFPLVRRYLSYLYAAALVCGALLPGAPARLAVMLSLMLTYWYTNHLKPLTWVKNAVCAALIAFAPLTSGSAALHLAASTTTAVRTTTFAWWRMGPVWRVVAMLFFGILGREMTMDCNDVENDRAVGVQTIPVVYGPAFASRVALACAGVAAALALVGPLRDVRAAVPRAVWMRRLGLAGVASAIHLTGAWRVWKTEGRERNTVNWAVDAGAKTILLFLASYL